MSIHMTEDDYWREREEHDRLTFRLKAILAAAAIALLLFLGTLL